MKTFSNGTWFYQQDAPINQNASSYTNINWDNSGLYSDFSQAMRFKANIDPIVYDSSLNNQTAAQSGQDQSVPATTTPAAGQDQSVPVATPTSSGYDQYVPASTTPAAGQDQYVPQPPTTSGYDQYIPTAGTPYTGYAQPYATPYAAPVFGPQNLNQQYPYQIVIPANFLPVNQAYQQPNYPNPPLYPLPTYSNPDWNNNEALATSGI